MYIYICIYIYIYIVDVQHLLSPFSIIAQDHMDHVTSHANSFHSDMS